MPRDVAALAAAFPLPAAVVPPPAPPSPALPVPTVPPPGAIEAAATEAAAGEPVVVDEIDTDKSRLDFAVIHGFLSRSHWAAGIPAEVLRRAIDGSLCFGVYRDGAQIGFARVVTDYATFAYLADVFVLEAYRNEGIGRKLMAAIQAHPELQGLRRWLLVTRNAQRLYRRCGFSEPPPLYSVMERVDPDIYGRGAAA
jgi:GNAT superfamily N-acetyltransferase